MINKEYIRNVLTTKSDLQIPIDEHNQDLIHGILGIATESGELLDILKKHLFYGTPLDIAHIKEEIGDKFWYIAILCDYCKLTPEECMEANIDKLRIRYPELKWSKERATKRNLEKEREALEK